MTPNTIPPRQDDSEAQERLLRKLHSLSSVLRLLRVLRDRQARCSDDTGGRSIVKVRT